MRQAQEIRKVMPATRCGERPSPHLSEKMGGVGASLEQGLSYDGDFNPAQVSAYSVTALRENMS